MKKILATILCFASAACFSQDKISVTAICKNPTGHVYHFGNTGEIDELKDGFKNSTWVFSWDSRSPESGKIISQSSSGAGGTPEVIDISLVTYGDSGSITFIAPYQHGIWIYTLFLREKIMLASRHMAIGVKDEPNGGTFHAKCDVSIK